MKITKNVRNEALKKKDRLKKQIELIVIKSIVNEIKTSQSIRLTHY